jgi:hypothetical protein
MEWGGPVWHASVSPRSLLACNERALFDEVTNALHGVGDALLGEWRERRPIAMHLRRRLTEHEMRSAGIAAVCDVRGTKEFTTRIRRIRPFLPDVMRGIPDEALP